MTAPRKILLVAKPWRGGLANYVFTALNELCPGTVEWLPTRPVSLRDKLSYRQSRKNWEQRLVERIAGQPRDLALFINHLPVFSRLDYHPGNVLWLTDGPNPSPGEYDAYAKVFLSDPGYLDRVAAVLPQERVGGELGFAYCPKVHNWEKPRSEKKQLCFIGNKDAKRDPYIEAALKSELSLTVIGNYFFRHPLFWEQPGSFSPSIDNAAMGPVYAAHKLSLNLHAQIVRQGTNMRTFECAGYGIPQLVEHRPGIKTYFEPGVEIETFTDCEEMLEKARQLLADPVRRTKLASNAHKRAVAQHSYKHRLQAVLEQLA